MKWYWFFCVILSSHAPAKSMDRTCLSILKLCTHQPPSSSQAIPQANEKSDEKKEHLGLPATGYNNLFEFYISERA